MTAVIPLASVKQAVAPANAHAPLLRVDLGAIRRNYHEARRRYRGELLSAVVKSDAYGLGIEPVVTALSAAGCAHFWVNDLEEAACVRPIAPGAAIYTLMGLCGHHIRDFEALSVIPALVGLDEVEHCAGHAVTRGRPCHVAIQIDTGLGRLGVSERDLGSLGESGTLDRLDIRLWVSHLAAYNLPDDPANREQRRMLVAWTSRLPRAPISLAASSGIFMEADWHFDMARVGSAMLGVQTSIEWQDGLTPCYELSAPVIRIAQYPQGRCLGYRGVTTLTRPSRIATAAIGYANGLPQQAAIGGSARLAGMNVPLVGGIAMNMTMLDITDVPEPVSPPGARAIFLDRDLPIEPLAERLGCAPNVLLTQIGAGTRKCYVED
jgi:alanine racemase